MGASGPFEVISPTPKEGKRVCRPSTNQQGIITKVESHASVMVAWDGVAVQRKRPVDLDQLGIVPIAPEHFQGPTLADLDGPVIVNGGGHIRKEGVLVGKTPTAWTVLIAGKRHTISGDYVHVHKRGDRAPEAEPVWKNLAPVSLYWCLCHGCVATLFC